MTCLLCEAVLEVGPAFYQLFLLRQPSVELCQACLDSFEKIEEPHCPTCCKPGGDETCSDCLYWEKQGRSVSHKALYHYNEAMKDYFSRYKFEGDYLLRKVFGKEIKQALKTYKGYTLVPIPLSEQREEERGFNQVTGFLDAAGLTYENLLVKAESQKQSEKTRAERLQTKNHFSLREGVPLPEKVLIVDDIYTTGATLTQAAQLFYERGVKELKTFSLTR